MNRRDALKSLGVLTLTTSALLELEGCKDAVAELEKWIPVGLQAFTGVIALINPPAGGALALALIAANVAWAAVQSAIKAYKNAPPLDKATLLGKIDIALVSLISNLNNILAIIPAAAKDADKIKAALNLIIATLMAIEGGLEPATAIGSKRARPAITATSNGVVAPKSVGEFKSRYNAIVGPGYAI